MHLAMGNTLFFRKCVIKYRLQNVLLPKHLIRLKKFMRKYIFLIFSKTIFFRLFLFYGYFYITDDLRGNVLFQ